MLDDLAEKTVVAKPTPAWLKRTLLFLLFVFSAAGFASGMFLTKKSSRLFSSTLGQQFKFSAMNSGGSSGFSGKIDPSRWNRFNNTITCQGTIIPKNGKALAMINGKTITAGGTINGVRILGVTDSHVLIEWNGKTRQLEPGKSFTPEKK